MRAETEQPGLSPAQRRAMRTSHLFRVQRSGPRRAGGREGGSGLGFGCSARTPGSGKGPGRAGHVLMRSRGPGGACFPPSLPRALGGFCACAGRRSGAGLAWTGSTAGTRLLGLRRLVPPGSCRLPAASSLAFPPPAERLVPRFPLTACAGSRGVLLLFPPLGSRCGPLPGAGPWWARWVHSSPPCIPSRCPGVCASALGRFIRCKDKARNRMRDGAIASSFPGFALTSPSARTEWGSARSEK